MDNFIDLVAYFFKNNKGWIIIAGISVIGGFFRFVFGIGSLKELILKLIDIGKLVGEKIFLPFFRFLYRVISSLFLLLFRLFFVSENKRYYWIGLAVTLFSVFTYQFVTFYLKEKTYKVGILYSAEQAYPAFHQIVRGTVDSVLKKNGIEHEIVDIPIHHNPGALEGVLKEFDLLLSVMSFGESRAVMNYCNSQAGTPYVIDLLSHPAGLSTEGLNNSRLYNLKYEPDSKDIEAALNILVKSNRSILVLSEYRGYQIKTASETFIYKREDDISHYMYQFVQRFDTIVIDNPYAYRMLTDNAGMMRRNLTVINLEYPQGLDSAGTKDLHLISLVPSSDSSFYLNYRKFREKGSGQFEIFNFMLSGYCSAILDQVRQKGIFVLDTAALFNKEFNTPIGKIRFDRRMQNLDVKTAFYDFGTRKFIIPATKTGYTPKE